MKIIKLTLIAAIIIAPFITSAQSQFDKFEDMDGVSSVIVNQRAFSLMAQIGAESDDEYLDLIKNIKSLRVFATEEDAASNKMEAEVTTYLKTAKLEELMRVNDDGNNVKIYVKEGKNEEYVKELFMFVKSKDEQTVVVLLTGDINLTQISKLTAKMNIPGGEHLDKATTKK